MLALKVEYLTGVCMATRHNDPDRRVPEWPPHPDRLFSALVAAAAEPCDGDVDVNTHIPEAARNALQWLLNQGAPLLAASPARRRAAPDVHMPSNPHPTEIPTSLEPGPRTRDREKRRKELEAGVRNLLPVHRKKGGLPIPAVIPDEPAVHFVWPNAEPNEVVHEQSTASDLLTGIAERVTRLGRSRSLVQLCIVTQAPATTHLPDPLGQEQLRVPGPDRLGYLIDKFRRDGGKPEPCPVRRYRRVSARSHSSRTLHSAFERVFIFKPSKGDPLLSAESTVKVTRVFREALIASIEEDQRARGVEPRIPDIVHGHGEHPHCAYVALPSVHPWQRHADGTIKGLALIVPRTVQHDDLLDLACGLIRLQENGLGIPGIGTWRLQEVPADDPPIHTLDPMIWTQASRIWVTATPMVFGHFPKRNDGGEPKVILDSLQMIGIDPDNVTEIAVGRHSPLHGAPPSWSFKTRRDRESNGQPKRLIRHVTLRFKHPVEGPILLGCMRYFGLGLMRPLEES